MKAVIYHGIGNVSVEEIPKPELIPGSIIVKVMKCGICGTDMYAYNRSGDAMLITPGSQLGHEFAGIVEAVADDVEDIKAGDHVYCNPMNWREPTPDRSREAAANTAGGFAEYFRVEHAKFNYNVEKLAPEMSWDLAAVIEPCAVAYEALMKHKFKAGDKVVIYGGGKIGQCALALLKVMGIDDVIVTARNPLRAGLAERIGGVVANTKEKPAPEFIKEYWGTGIGNCNEETWLADLAVDAGGWDGALEELIANAKAGSDISILALGQTPAQVFEPDLVNKGISIHGSYAYTPEDCQEVIKLIEKDPERFTPLVTAVFPLDQITEAFAAANDSRSHMKVLVDCQK